MGEQSILKMNGTMHKKVHTLIAGFLRSPQLKARITRDIEHTVKQCLASWTSHQTIYVQDQVKRVSSLSLFALQLFFPNPLLFSHFPQLFLVRVYQITFPVLVKVLMSVGPGEELDFLYREFAEFIKGLICLPLKFPGTRLYKSLKVP